MGARQPFWPLSIVKASRTRAGRASRRRWRLRAFGALAALLWALPVGADD